MLRDYQLPCSGQASGPQRIDYPVGSARIFYAVDIADQGPRIKVRLWMALTYGCITKSHDARVLTVEYCY